MTGQSSDRPTQRDRARARQGRIVAIVIAVTMVLWLGLNYAGRQLGWPVRLAFLFDLAAIAALLWSLVVTWWIWTARKKDGS